MKTLAALLISTVTAAACPFAVGTKVVTPDGHKGTVTEAFSSAADAVESATVKFEDGTEREYTDQPGVEVGTSELCDLRDAG